ncbi:MAG: hypothetical protein BGO64_13295 [Aeromonas sp. 62-46]|nr:hypothetical protein BFG06_12185 [Aeromonas caviae]OJW68276.1 MAG: hypothetical protein BGO64_13295 [Aeromonas sp. 62-46]
MAFPLVFRDGRERHPLVQMSHGLKMLSVSKCYIHDLALVFIALPGKRGRWLEPDCWCGEAGGMSEARGRDSKFATYFTFYKQFFGWLDCLFDPAHVTMRGPTSPIAQTIFRR